MKDDQCNCMHQPFMIVGILWLDIFFYMSDYYMGDKKLHILVVVDTLNINKIQVNDIPFGTDLLAWIANKLTFDTVTCRGGIT